MKYDKFGKRLSRAITANNLDETAVAKKLKVTRQAVNTWTGGRSVPGFETLIELANILKTSLDHLMRGINFTSVLDYNGQTTTLTLTLRPVYSSIHLDSASQIVTGNSPVGEHLYQGILPDTCFLLNVNSNNLSGPDPSISIHKGDTVVIDTLRKPRHGDFVLTIFDDYSTDFYQYFVAVDEVILHSLNPNIPDYRVDFSTVREFFPVLEVFPRSRKLI